MPRKGEKVVKELTRPAGPDDPQPADWPDNWWLAYQTLARGGTQRQAGEAVGRAVNTISRWRGYWIRWWGQDFVPVGHANTAKGAHANLTVAQLSNPGTGITLLHAASRVAQANLFGATAEKAALIISSRLEQIAASPVELGMLGPKDLVDLARVVAMLNQQAGSILGENQNNSGMGGTRADVDLTGLEAHTDQDRATLDAAELIIRDWHAGRGTEPAEVIDITEAG